ncbi:MAG: hypothetical protein WDN75_15915 [Bacteroidota bacterium]
MRTITIFIIFSGCSIGFCFAQNGKLESDSVNINIQRSAISKELMLLRDSINLTITEFDFKIKNAKADKKVKLESAQKDLADYVSRVKSDLQETSLTAKNAWTVESVARIHTSTTATRREYYRIRSMIAK